MNANKDAECSVERGCSSESTSKEPTFTVQIKGKEAISELEGIGIPIQRTVATHKYCCICFSTKVKSRLSQVEQLERLVYFKFHTPLRAPLFQCHVTL